MKIQVYLVGGNGFLGRNLQAIWSKDQLRHIELIPVLRPNPIGIYPDHCIGLDALRTELSKPSRVRRCVINCAALADVPACQQHPELSRQVNYRLAIDLAGISKRFDAAFIQISSDGVFPVDDAPKPPRYWKISQAKKGASVYAQDKLDAEQALENLDFGTAIRLSFIGPSLGTNRGLINYLAQSFKSRTEAVGFTDNWFNPLHVQQVAKGLLARILNPPFKDSFSIEQWGCSPAVSKGDFLQKVVEATGLDIPVVYKLRGSGPFNLDQTMECSQPSELTEVIALSASSLISEIRSGQP